MNNVWSYLIFYFIADTVLIASVWFDRRRPISSCGSEKAVGLGVRVLAQLADVYFAALVGWLAFGVLFLLNEHVARSYFIEQAMGFYFWTIFCTITGVVYFIHSFICTALFGKTLGKMLLRIKVVLLDGSIPGYGVTLKRFFSYLVFFITVGYASIGLFRNVQKRGFHDRICGTKVVYTGFPNFVVVIGVLFIFHILGLMRPA